MRVNITISYTVIVIFTVVFCQYVFAQEARIVRPTVVANNSRSISVKPTIAGFRIGESLENAILKLGEPVRMEKLGNTPDTPVSYQNSQTGITLIGGKTEGVGIILVTHRESGNLDGIQVGDPKEKVIAKWGHCAAGDKFHWLWLAGEFVVSIQFDKTDLVHRIGVGLGQ